MISAKLQGGLGNQMFQIAAAFGLSKSMGVKCKFDFNTCWTPAQGNVSNLYKETLFKGIDNGPLNQNDFKIYNEPGFGYDELPKINNLLLNGYFQSEKYFSKYKEDVINLFDFSQERIDKIYEFLEEIDSDVITAIHVRRGDYLKNSNFHPPCSLEYYKQSINIIGDGKFVFISDDIEWCKEHFKNDNIYFSPFTEELDDLCLITQCDNQIIANSSFSWWGAYLCDWGDNIVVAPKKWFGPQGPQDTKYLIPDGWLIN